MRALSFQPRPPRVGEAGVLDVRLDTPLGPIPGRLHHAAEGEAAVLWVFGSGGGLGGPAGGLYLRLAEALREEGVTSLELDYRIPGRIRDCVEDALTGVAYLESLGKTRIALVGHSFGGAVVIAAGAAAPAVGAVAALSSQTQGTDAAAALAPKPVLFAHGEADDVLPARGSRSIYDRAGEPKRLITYPGAGHGLDECREALDRDLLDWLRTWLEAGPSPVALRRVDRGAAAHAAPSI